MFRTIALIVGLFPALAFAQDARQIEEINLKRQAQQEAALEQAKAREAVFKEEAVNQRQLAEKARQIAEKERARAEDALEAARRNQKLAEQQKAQAEASAEQARMALQAELKARKNAEAAKKQAEVALEKAKADATVQEPKKKTRRGRRQNRMAGLEKQIQALTQKVEDLQVEVNGLKATLQKDQASSIKSKLDNIARSENEKIANVKQQLEKEAEKRRWPDWKEREDAIQKLIEEEREKNRSLEDKLRTEGLKRFDELKGAAEKIETELELKELRQEIEAQVQKQLETLPQKQRELESVKQQIEDTILQEKAALERELKKLSAKEFQLEDFRKQIEKTLEKEAGEALVNPGLETRREAKASEAEARYVFKALDQTKDGYLSSDEWKRSKSIREGFEKNGITLETPADIDSFLDQYPPHRLVPQLRVPDTK